MKDKNYAEYMRFGVSVIYFRRMKGLTQEQLAEKMDVHFETISRIENANTGISMDMLINLSKALDISLSELFAHASL